MSIKISIKDGSGSDLEAKVGEVGKKKEPTVWVNLAGISPGFYVPIGPALIGDRFDDRLSLDGLGVTYNMAVDGASTPQVFKLLAGSTKDIIITEIIIFGHGGSIQLGRFFSITALTNGCELVTRSDNKTTTYRRLKTTNDIDAWSSIAGFTFRAEASGDNAKGILQLTPALPIRAQGTFGADPQFDDYISFTINDNVTSVSNLYMIVRGIEVDRGTL